MMINWAEADRGTDIKNCSSAVIGCQANNLLDPSLNCIWLTEEGHKIPHWVTIHISKPTPDLCLKTIGWHCWHSYNTNPKTVLIHVSSDGYKAILRNDLRALKDALKENRYGCLSYIGKYMLKD